MQLDNARRVLKTFSSHLGEQADTTYADTQLIAQSNTSSFEDRRRKNTAARCCAGAFHCNAHEYRINVESILNKNTEKYWKSWKEHYILYYYCYQQIQISWHRN